MAGNTLTRTQQILKKMEREQLREGHKKLLFKQLEEAKLPYPQPEYIFHPTRKWKIDFAWPQYNLALEVEGGVYTKQGGGHRSISGWDENLEKYNELALYSWYLIRITPEMLGFRNGKAIELVKRALINNCITGHLWKQFAIHLICQRENCGESIEIDCP